MIKAKRKIISVLIAIAMVCTSFLSYIPANVKAAPESGRKWITINSGARGGGGHAYGNAGTNAPALLLDNDKRMEESGEISLALRPDNDNWGIFYSYVDDSNWLYVGYDPSSKWYYQYKLNGSESYPQIPGLPEPVIGEEMQISISLNRETLSVTVNGTTARVTNQTLISYADATSGNGRFGVKVNGANQTISFADFMYGTANCMEDEWVFCADRGHQMTEDYTVIKDVTGTVTNTEGTAIEGATVRLGSRATTTDVNGNYAIAGVEVGEYNMAITKAGYQSYESVVEVGVEIENVFNATLQPKANLDLNNYDNITSDVMKVYIGKEFPLVARYEMVGKENTFFRGNETALNTIVINGCTLEPEVTVTETTTDSRTYEMHCQHTDDSYNIDVILTVKISVKDNTLTWEVTDIQAEKDSQAIASIDVPSLSLLSVDAAETGANFAGAQVSTTTTTCGDVFIDFENGFVPSNKDGYLYAFLQNGKLSAGLFSNSEAEGDKRVIRVNGADTITLTSAPWYYEKGDKNGQNKSSQYDPYPKSELPYAKVAIGADENEDGEIDWNDGALAFRDIMHVAYGSDVIKDIVNYRIVMNFASMASNPYHTTADNIKKVYLATDGLPQAVMLKGYGNEGHDSANSEYADIAEREGGVEDFQELIKIAHDYNTEVGIHVNAQEIYPEAKSMNEDMIESAYSYGWGWLDQSLAIDKLWDLSSQARWKRFVQLYDRINNTEHLSIKWPEAVKDSQGEVDMSKEDLKKEAESLEDNMDFIYLDVWYQDAWETRQIAKEINSLGWRFSTEFSAQGEYDSTWQHWSTDASYGGATSKGFNSAIIRFIRNDQRDSQVLNYPSYGGAADNPLLGGYRLYGFEGWGGDRDYNNYILQTFNQNLPTKFLQHYYVIDWEDYAEGESPVGNNEKEITLKNDNGDKVVVTRKEEQRRDENIERIITLNGKKVLEDVTYLLPWTDNQDGSEKLYHWNLEGGTTTWELPDGWNVENVIMYELSDQGRINEKSVEVIGNSVTLEAKAATAYVLVKGTGVKTLKNDFGEYDYVVDPGFNGYAAGEKLSSDEWSGDIDDESVVVEKANTGDQRLAFNSPSKDVAVTTTIHGLKSGVDYVAEVYVENNSDAKASIEVATKDNSVSNYTERSILNNYVKSDQKNGTKMQRMQVSFTADAETAKITLARKAGAGSSYMDDIRVVEKSLNNFREDGSFVQDFETVVQGLYPFVLSSAQGISDPVTHLSQLNAPYTQHGWGGRVIDDVIDGEWSVKHHGSNNGILYQTIPQNFRFEPGKVYTVEFDYQSGPDKGYAMVVGEGTSYTAPAANDCLPQARGTTQHVKMQVIGGGSGQTWIGIYTNRPSGSTSIGETDFTLDNLVIKENKDAIAVTISSKELYKGETADIFGTGLDKITWTSSDENIVVVEGKKVNALAAGEAVLTAAKEDGEVIETFDMTVMDSVVTEIARDEYPEITSSANTQQTSGEPEGSGVASAAADGDSSTYWHSAWNGFTVSADNPAILTVDFGKELEIGGFKFQQRPSANNGIVRQYGYRALDAEGNVLEEKHGIASTDAERVGGGWITVTFDGKSKAAMNVKVIEIYVESGQGDFAAIAEVAPIRIMKVAETATLKDATVKVGEAVTLEPEHAAGTMLTGLKWSSSNEEIAVVNENGIVTAKKHGTTVITVSNVAGLEASCTITVKGNEPVKTDKSDLEVLFTYAGEQMAKDGYTSVIPAVRTALEAKYDEAENILADDTVSQEEVDKVYKELLALVHMLDFIGGDNVPLQKLADDVENFYLPNIDDYTEETAAALQDAYAKALEVLKDGENALAGDIKTATEALQKAIDELEEVEVKVDKSRLQMLVDQANATDTSGYTEASVATMQEALALGELVLNTDGVSQGLVDTVADALEAALNGLEVKVPEKEPADKSELLEVYNSVKDTKLDGYTAESVRIFSEALKAAEAVLANDNLTKDDQAVVDKVTAVLRAAYAGLTLEAPSVNKDALKKLIDKSVQYAENEALYTPESYQIFKAAYDAALETYSDETATQDAVDAARVTLEAARRTLREIPNKDKLEELLGKIKEVDLSLYTAKTAKAVKAAYAQAVAVFEDENATQVQIDQAVKALEEVTKELKKEDNTAVSGGQKSEDDNKVASDNSGKTTTTNNNNKTAKTPVKTGDAANAVIWMALILAAALTGMTFKKRARR